MEVNRYILNACILEFRYIYTVCFFFKGPPGTKIQITGSNLGTDILDISVMINNIRCNVTMVNDSVLQCIVGEHAGGTFPVVMHHGTKGFAVSTAVFAYPLTIQNIRPSQGSHERAGTYKYSIWFQ